MRIFKHRGDIYIPKAKNKESKQAKVLYFLLAVTVVFTAVFLIFLSQKYDSAAQFFGEGEITEEAYVQSDEEQLPTISGKTNFLIIETDDEESIIHYIFLIEADKDNTAYKVAAFSPDTVINNKKIIDIYSTGGGAAIQSELKEYLKTEIDYYAAFKNSSFVEFTNKLGSFIYNSNEEIRYSGGKGDDKYTLHINEGEQKIKGRELANIMRYYCSEKSNFSAADEIILKALSSLFNPENYENSEALFRLFIKSAKTDITVRDFENGKDAINVFCNKNEDITLYYVVAQYKDGELSQKTKKEIKGYFSK